MTGEVKDTGNISWETDELGAVARFTIDTSVYSKIAVFKTAYWYTERCYLFLSRLDDPSQCIGIEVRPKNVTNQHDLVALCREFSNSLIDQQVRQDVIAETGPVRDALIKKAFFEGSHHLEPDKLRSDEGHVPEPGQSYKNDPLKITRPTGS